MRRLALLLAATVAVAGFAGSIVPPSPAAAAPAAAVAGVAGVNYRPPVDAPIVDEYRPPANPWDPGNRGIDYATAPGTPVKAAAAGVVTFAGQVGGALHVVVLHADGIRTSYSFLATVGVRRGDQVVQGQPLGTSGPTLHFGARVGDSYIDPRTLFDDGPPRVNLVPDEPPRPAPEAAERAALAGIAAGRPGIPGARLAQPEGGSKPGWLARARDWAGDRVATAGRSAPGWGRVAAFRVARTFAQRIAASVPARAAAALAGAASQLAAAGTYWWHQRFRCTPRHLPPPPLPERRIAVTVGGLGSTSSNDAIDELDTARLGYDEGDVQRFSYLGGSILDSPYAAEDTTVDIRTSARRLADLLADLHRRHPGVPIDILAHSQGGLVARQALAFELPADPGRYPSVANLVTLATPHRGAKLATALSRLGSTLSGKAALAAVEGLGLAPYDLTAPSLGQLAEGSEFIRRLNQRPLPAATRVTSIGARGDLTVPAGQAHVPGATNTVVSVGGLLTDHDRLPGSEVAHREVALALAGEPPTCQDLWDVAADAAVSGAIGLAEDGLGMGLERAGGTVDRRARGVFEGLWRMMRARR